MGDNSSDKKPPSRKSINKQDNPAANVKYTSNNPYLNFLSDFRKRPENRRLSGAILFRAAAKVWKTMSPNQKMPYINAAKKYQKSFDTDKKADKNIRKVTPKTARYQKKKDFTTLIKGGFRTLYNNNKAARRTNYVPPKKALKREQERSYPKRCSRCGHRHGDEEDNSPSRTTTTRCSSTTHTNATTTNQSRTSNSGSDVSRSSYSF